MHALKTHRLLIGSGFILLLLVISFTTLKLTATPTWTTAVVERGTVSNVVAVSGFVEAVDAANLSFPQTGVVTDVFVREGDTVVTGQLLATLGSSQLVAERKAAVATLEEALAGRTELQSGPTSEARAVTSVTLAAAETALHETTQTEAEKVQSAKAALLSNDLEAVSNNNQENAPAPTVSGSYTCTKEGNYEIEIYRSGALSGYSYTVSGLETNTDTVTVDQPSPIGECGLYIQFVEGESYTNTTWTVSIPNVRSSTYTTYKNALDLALRQQAQNVASAEAALAIAKNEATAANAAPRVESLIKANATVQAAEAKIAAIDAKIADTSIAAPFSGTITNVDIVQGETANLSPVMTILGETSFTLTARIPEIDITRVAADQAVSIRFDARSNETFSGNVVYVSPLPTTIDGVAYFDATIVLTESPTWIRAGLNADVDITLETLTDTIRIPERFLTRTTTGDTVQIPNGKRLETQAVTVRFIGNDGYAAITGLNEGDVVVAPQN